MNRIPQNSRPLPAFQALQVQRQTLSLDSTGITTVKSSLYKNGCLSFLFPHPPRLNLSSYSEFKREFYNRNYFYQNITKSPGNLLSYTGDNFRIDIEIRESYEILSHSYIFNFKNNWTSLNTSYLGK